MDPQEKATSVRDAVLSALQEHYGEDGLLLHLKALILQGLRSEITDALLEQLELNPEKRIRSHVLEILYFIHGTGGSYIVEGLADPRPENAKADQPISVGQLDRLLNAALTATDKEQWDSYISLLHCMWPHPSFTVDATAKLKSFIKICISDGSSYTRDRATRCENQMQEVERNTRRSLRRQAQRRPKPKVEQSINAAEKKYPLIRMWNELDEEMIQAAFVRSASGIPWQTDDAKLKDIWNRLTDPQNLAALEAENQRQGLNAYAKEARERALSACRMRIARK